MFHKQEYLLIKLFPINDFSSSVHNNHRPQTYMYSNNMRFLRSIKTKSRAIRVPETKDCKNSLSKMPHSISIMYYKKAL